MSTQVERLIPGPVCESFAWVGGPFHHCDRCGQPFWEHTHRDGRPSTPFGPDDSVPVPILPEEAEAVRAKWGRGYHVADDNEKPGYDVLLETERRKGERRIRSPQPNQGRR